MTLNKQEWANSKKFAINMSEKVIRGTAISIFSEIIRQTPTDIGTLKGNWQTTVAAPATGKLTTADKLGEATVAKARAKVMQYKVGETLYMTNNLPYAYAIARGHSKLRPDGWIERIIAGFQKTIDREAKKNK